MADPADDIDVDDDGQGGSPSESGLQPVKTPPIQRPAPAAGDDEQYDIVETDAGGKPIGGAEPYTADEGRLSEGEAGTRPVIQQQGDGGDGQQRREPKSQRNARRRESRERTWQENERLRGEVELLRQRLDNFEGTATTRLTELGEVQIQQQIGRLDNNISNAEAAYKAAGARIAAAMSSADNDALVAALEDRDKALVTKTQLGNEKKQIEKMLDGARAAPDGGEQRQTRQQQPVPQQRQAPLPARVQTYVRAFGEQHEWYNSNPPPTDLDSQTVLMLDRAVANEGYLPDSPDYWAELEDRMRERMPWRFEDGGQQPNQRPQNDGRQGQRQQPAPQQQQRRGPPAGGVGDRGPVPQNRRQVMISPDRKDAMIQAGAIGPDGRVLDAPKYKRLLKSYAEFDRTNAVGR